MKFLKRIFLLVVLFIYCHSLSGQLLRDNDVDETTVKAWIEKDLEQYEDRYIFQPNDGNFLIIIVDEENISAQIHIPSYWSDGGYALELGLADSSELKFHSEYIPLTNVTISNGKFYSDQYRGEFITFKLDTVYQGIKIYDSWSICPGYKYEIGVKRQEQLKNIYNGTYPEASLSILSSNYLSSFSKEELKIMRNEIYARYDYRFKENGEMDIHFSKLDWYSARYKPVVGMLTWIELKNIELIKSIEKKQ